MIEIGICGDALENFENIGRVETEGLKSCFIHKLINNICEK